MVACGDRSDVGAGLKVDRLAVEPRGLHAGEEQRLGGGGGGGEARRGVEAARVELLGQLAVDKRVDRGRGGRLGERARGLVVEDPEAGDVALAGVERTRLADLAEEGVEVAAGDARDAVGKAGGHDAADVVTADDVSLEDREFDARAGADEELGRGLAGRDAGHQRAILHLERESMVAFLHLRSGVQHAFDDVVERGARAEAAEVRAELAAGAADGVAYRATRLAILDFAFRRVGAFPDGVDDAGDLGFVIARSGLGTGEGLERLHQGEAAAAKRAGGLERGGEVVGAQSLGEFLGESLGEAAELEEVGPDGRGFILRLDLREDRGDGLEGFARSVDGEGGQGVATDGGRAGFGGQAAERVERSLLADRAEREDRGAAQFGVLLPAGEVAELRHELHELPLTG